jgi:hypothetical protein
MRNTKLRYIFKYIPGEVMVSWPKRIFEHARWVQEIYYQSSGMVMGI